LDSLPWWAHAIGLLVLLAISAFFSISETSMMALNRYKLSALVKQGKKSAKVASELLGQTDKLLGTILLGNNLVNTAVTTLVTALAIRFFGNNDTVLLIATAGVAFAIIVFCEITPKVIGANFPEKIALPSSHLLRWIMKIASPFVWFVNLFVGWLLKLIRIDPNAGSDENLTQEELRGIVIESGTMMPHKHRSIALNLFDLEKITVDDVMTPRAKVESIDITDSIDQILEQLETCYHNKIPVFEQELNRVIGVLHVRKALGLIRKPNFEPQQLRSILSEPYFVPSETPVFTQLQYFQENKQRVALIVDEYGEVLGLLTLEDIIEEIVGEFTTSSPGVDGTDITWDELHSVQVEGGVLLRDLNRRLGTQFNLDGPKTINGLVLEQLQELPEGLVSIRVKNLAIEIIQLQGRSIKTLKLKRLDLTKDEPLPLIDPDRRSNNVS
jgi:Mg2+/Co2+ transporter CorB